MELAWARAGRSCGKASVDGFRFSQGTNVYDEDLTKELVLVGPKGKAEMSTEVLCGGSGFFLKPHLPGSAFGGRSSAATGNVVFQPDKPP